MSTNPLSSIAERLNAAHLAVANSLADGEIQSLVAAYGYPSAKLTEGKSLYHAALAAVNTQKSAEGAQRQSTQELNLAEKLARDVYASLSKVARAIFEHDKPRLTALGLDGTAPRDTPGLIAAASALFENAAGAPALAEYGYDAARLAADRMKVSAFELTDQAQEAAKGAAQQATREQEAAMRSLDAWRAQYVKIARVALREKPQLLEKLGVAARTSKTAAQKAGRKKVAA